MRACVLCTYVGLCVCVLFRFVDMRNCERKADQVLIIRRRNTQSDSMKIATLFYMTSVVSRFPLARVTCEIPTYNEQGG